MSKIRAEIKSEMLRSILYVARDVFFFENLLLNDALTCYILKDINGIPLPLNSVEVITGKDKFYFGRSPCGSFFKQSAINS